MKLIVQPEAGVVPIVQAIKAARKTIDVFIFRFDRIEIEKALAAAVQPLIQGYKFRRFPWINVWSPADIISGNLDLYDDRSAAGEAEHFVHNETDPKATTPLAAHTAYWKNPLIFTHLHGRLL